MENVLFFVIVLFNKINPEIGEEDLVVQSVPDIEEGQTDEMDKALVTGRNSHWSVYP